MKTPRRLLLLWLALPLAAHALCTSEEAPQPAALLERFISADCLECWSDPRTPRAAADTLALDWVLPGRQGEEAPLSTVALVEARERLSALRRPVPGRAGSVAQRRTGAAVPLRLAQGDAFNDYVAASLELQKPGREAWRAWLLLVEQLPAGIQGSPVPRNLVRNVFRPDWHAVDGGAGAGAGAGAALSETRAMQIHEGAQAGRLRLVAVLQDARGRLRAITQTTCPE